MKTPIQSAGEAAPKTSTKSVSLLDCIATYRALWAIYMADESDQSPKDYEPTLRLLENWKGAAESGEAAKAALRLAIDFEEIGSSLVVASMMKASLRFLEQQSSLAATKRFSTRISDVEDILASARYLNEAVFMAATGIGDTEQRDAIQAVADEINKKLLVARDRLDEIREEMADA